MSETDSFIDEVNEEVRRDRLYGALRRYGWIAILAVLAKFADTCGMRGDPLLLGYARVSSDSLV